MDIEPVPGTPPGDYPLRVSVSGQDGGLLAEAGIVLSLLDARLPEQKLIYSRWLHSDSIASTYHLPMYSVEHIRALRGFVQSAARRGMNMVYTPIHTPPIMIRDGREPPINQLTDVFVTPLGYSFRFSKLRDFISLCRHEGIRYFEMAHFFGPRGRAPAVMGVQDGAYTRLFGPETPSDDPKYQVFLAAYIPALLKELSYNDVLDSCFFHLTDMPLPDDRAQYRKLLAMTLPLLRGARVIDTLPDPAFAAEAAPGLIPVPELDTLGSLSAPERWVSLGYRRHGAYPDTLIAMPGSRTRVLGTLLYLEQIRGITHWALNYYAAESTGYPVDPYMNTDCDGLSPAGDAFLLYPGQGGVPEESIRIMHFQQALQDLRALQGLEKKIGREEVLALVSQGLNKPLSLASYPGDERWLLSLRGKVNERLAR